MKENVKHVISDKCAHAVFCMYRISTRTFSGKIILDEKNSESMYRIQLCRKQMKEFVQ